LNGVVHVMAAAAMSDATDGGVVESAHVGMTMLIAYGDGKKPPDDVMPARHEHMIRCMWIQS
jgi:hypothetical protein